MDVIGKNMKSLLKKIISFFAIIIIKIKANITIKKSIIFLSHIHTDNKSNLINLTNSNLEYSQIIIRGKNNNTNIQGNHSRIKIYIHGENNSLYIDKRTSLILSEITIRGKACKVQIGENTTFGKNCCLVCMGDKNQIFIGKQCMFAENIDIWNTDSHPILNTEGQIINHSKPISIGNHVWIGKYSKILKGTIIEDNSIVGMSTLVTNHIIHNTLNVGTPNRCIKKDINWDRNFINQ